MSTGMVDGNYMMVPYIWFVQCMVSTPMHTCMLAHLPLSSPTPVFILPTSFPTQASSSVSCPHAHPCPHPPPTLLAHAHILPTCTPASLLTSHSPHSSMCPAYLLSHIMSTPVSSYLLSNVSPIFCMFPTHFFTPLWLFVLANVYRVIQLIFLINVSYPSLCLIIR